VHALVKNLNGASTQEALNISLIFITDLFPINSIMFSYVPIDSLCSEIPIPMVYAQIPTVYELVSIVPIHVYIVPINIPIVPMHAHIVSINVPKVPNHVPIVLGYVPIVLGYVPIVPRACSHDPESLL
jgi:hypothetical protein